MIYSITKEIQFDAGHRVPDHKSKCRNPHGHRYRVCATLAADNLVGRGSSKGMVMDFGDVKTILTEKIHDVLDHGFIVYEKDHDLMHTFGYAVDPEPSLVTDDHGWKIIIFPFVPTAENIARWCFREFLYGLGESNLHGKVTLKSMTVWETPTSSATYEE